MRFHKNLSVSSSDESREAIRRIHAWVLRTRVEDIVSGRWWFLGLWKYSSEKNREFAFH